MYSFDFSPPMAWQLLDELAQCAETMDDRVRSARPGTEDELRACFDCIQAYALGLELAAREPDPPAHSVMCWN